MPSAILLDSFKENISRIRHLLALHDTLSSTLTNVVDLSDMLRSQVVMIVSSLDHYVHEIVFEGMVDIVNGRRPATEAFDRFQIDLRSSLSITRSINAIQDLEQCIRARLSYQSFQKSKRISDGISLFSKSKIWKPISKALNDKSENVTRRLDLLVDRRNKIAHEADIDPTYFVLPRGRWKIDSKLISDATDFVENLVFSMHSVIK